MSLGTVKELQVLQELGEACPNIVNLLNVFPYSDRVNMVIELAQYSLMDVLQDADLELAPGDIKAYLHMLLSGLAFCHSRQLVHRVRVLCGATPQDLKPENLLLTREGVLKVADFGLAAFLHDDKRLHHHRYATLWYRPPELLMGARVHAPAIDIWAVGCIAAELVLRKPLFPGCPPPEPRRLAVLDAEGRTAPAPARLPLDDDEVDQLARIFQLCGTPEQSWPVCGGGVRHHRPPQHYPSLCASSPRRRWTGAVCCATRSPRSWSSSSRCCASTPRSGPRLPRRSRTRTLPRASPPRPVSVCPCPPRSTALRRPRNEHASDGGCGESQSEAFLMDKWV